MSANEGVRLNKFISSSGYCSRREADKLIESNRVKINGRKPELGARVEAGDEVTVDGMLILGNTENKQNSIYIVYNKPVGITCTTDQSVKGNIIDAIDHDVRIFPIGRLDKPSEGLILLTSDGDIVNKILRGENNHSKEYVVTVNKAISADFADKMSKGIPILNTVTKPCKVSVQSKTVFKIILTQGLNRQIRRMCEYLGYDVVRLQRLRIMNIELGRLKVGQWRNVTREEMSQLNKVLESSSNENTSTKAKKLQRKKPQSKRAPPKKYSPYKPAEGDKKAYAKTAFKKDNSAGKRGEGKANKSVTKKAAKNRPAKTAGKKSFSPGKHRK